MATAHGVAAGITLTTLMADGVVATTVVAATGTDTTIPATTATTMEACAMHHVNWVMPVQVVPEAMVFARAVA